MTLHVTLKQAEYGWIVADRPAPALSGWVRLEETQGCLNVTEKLGMTLDRPTEGTATGVGPEDLSHSSRSAIRSSTVPRRTSPRASSCRACTI